MKISTVIVVGLLLFGCADDVDPWEAAYKPCEELMQRKAEAHVDDLLVSKIHNHLDFTRLASVIGDEVTERHVVPHPNDPNGSSTIVLVGSGESSFSYLEVNEKALPLCIHIGAAASPVAVVDIFAPGVAQDIAVRGPVFSSLEGHLLAKVGMADGEIDSLTLVSTYFD